MKTVERELIVKYCKVKHYNVDNLKKLYEQRLDKYDCVMLRQPLPGLDESKLDGLKQDMDTIPRVIFELVLSTGEILERPWTAEVMRG